MSVEVTGEAVMKRDKLKSWDIIYFLVPFILLITIFSIITYTMVSNRIEERYGSFEEQAVGIADSYSQALVYAYDAQDTITNILNEKLTIVNKAITMIEGHEDIVVLKHLAEELNLDEISLYNREGEIIYSNFPDFVGWKVYEGHPIDAFMKSDDRTMVEDIRRDAISGVYKKYAYIKNDDGSFIQIGERAEVVHELVSQFEFQRLVDIIASKDDIEYVAFIDNNFDVLASSTLDSVGKTIFDDDYRGRMENNDFSVERVEFNGEDVLQTSVPIYHDEEQYGILNILWSTKKVDDEVRSLVSEGIGQFLIIFIFILGILYYAYRKNKSNVEITYYDKLTGLPNGEYLMEYLDGLIETMDEKKAIILINTRNFKTLNMTYGFAYGNQIIAEIAQKLRGAIRDEDRLFRFNADRFVLVVNRYETKEELVDLAESIFEVFKSESLVTSEHQYVNVEFGIVELKNREMTVDKLLQDATLALSHMDSGRSGSIHFYEDSMEETIIREDRIEKSLRNIIKNGCDDSFYLCYQPKLDLTSKRISGFEALARLKLDDLGFVSPLEFIDIAERRQLIYDLGRIILRESCEFISRAHAMGFEDTGVSINISGIQLLRKEFVGDVSDIANQFEMDPGCLEFEITESVLLENYEIINHKLKQIKDMGIRISIDDFGTGFSSLARLKELNIDIVKIDKYFIDAIIEKDKDSLITADIISMSHKLGLEVVAEGVENQEQLDYLEKNNCDIVQGYYIAKPLMEEEAIEKLKDFKL
jgi:diguanylate cyclase (GGDEF)-like protein